MDYNFLQKSGLKISSVSFGCMSLQSENQQGAPLIGNAIDAGINLFDTADLYERGANELLLGKALKGKRQDVLVSTKVGNRWKNDGSGWEWHPRKAYILNAVNASLRRLQTDYIDLYLLHGGTIEDPIDEAIEAFENLKDSGKIRAYGISSIRPNVIREYVKRSDIDAVMTQYSFLDRRPEEETLELLFQNKIGVLARGTVAGGLMIDKPLKPYLNRTEIEIGALLHTLDRAKPTEKSMYEAALQYVLAHRAVSTAVMGIRTEEQLQQALSASKNKGLTAAQYEILQSAVIANAYEEHR